MRGNDLFSVDSRQILAMFDRLEGPELKKAELMTLRSSANILKKKTDQNFKQIGINLTLRRRETITRKNGKKVTKIRRIATVRVKNKDIQALVHILSDFRVHWFETGTNERHTKGYSYRTENNKIRRRVGRWGFFYQRKGRGRSTGSIEPHWFFREAQYQTERQIFDNIKNELSKAIIKIANNKNRRN